MSDDAPNPTDSLDPIREMLRNPAARVYLAIAGGALLLLPLILFQLYFSALGAALVFVLGLLALVLRWTAMPTFLAVVVGYTAFSPFGVPIDISWSGPNAIPDSRFHIRDILLAGTLLTYLLAQFRLFALVHAAVPFEAGPLYVKKKAKSALRRADPVTDAELGGLFVRVVAFVLVGQLLWALVTWFQVDFREVPPVVAIEDDTNVTYVSASVRLGDRPAFGESPPWYRLRWLSRSLLAAGLFVAVGVGVRLAFWFWRHHAMSRERAKMLLTDIQWAENRREIDRQEKWRAWMVAKQNGTLPARGGCGTLFLVIGLPLLLAALYWMMMSAGGCVRG